MVNDNYYFKSDRAKSYDIVKDPSGMVLGTYTVKIYLGEDDFNAAGTINNYEKVVMERYKGRLLNIDDENEINAIRACGYRYEWLPDLTKYGIPVIKSIEVLDENSHTYISVPMDSWVNSGARVNFKIFPDEYIRTTYLCTTWLKYVITTKNTGVFRMGGESLSYAETLKYLNKLIGYTRNREEQEKKLIIEAGGEEYLNSHSKWDCELCEWRIKNQIPTLTPRSAKKYLKEVIE